MNRAVPIGVCYPFGLGSTVSVTAGGCPPGRTSYLFYFIPPLYSLDWACMVHRVARDQRYVTKVWRNFAFNVASSLLTNSELCATPHLGWSVGQFDDGWKSSWFHVWNGWRSWQTNQRNQRGKFNRCIKKPIGINLVCLFKDRFCFIGLVHN